jgi:phosphoserine aminotransferase
MLVLSPRAVERLETYTPSWPLPKIFRLTKKGKLNGDIFVGSTINTPSLLCVEDYLDALKWADASGGLSGLIERSESNLNIIRDFVESTEWIDFLPNDPATISCTSICLKVHGLDAKEIKDMTKLLDTEGVAFDINGYRDAPPSLRIWGGATVEPSDTEKLLPWLSWAYESVKASK